MLSNDGRKLVLGTAEGRGERLRFVFAVDDPENQQVKLRAVGETHRHAQWARLHPEAGIWLRTAAFGFLLCAVAQRWYGGTVRAMFAAAG